MGTVVSSQTKSEYWPALDALRAVAAIAVLVEHVYQSKPLIHFIVPGYFGVRFFFVLSGFLITNILLEERDKGLRWSHAVKAFYIRRCLRILPIYYLTLTVMAVLSNWVHGLQGHHAWRFLYATNWHMAIHDTGDVYYGHLWTLAVEEQFYLLWPWLVLLTPRRHLVWTVALVIILAPVARGLAAYSHANDFWIRKPTWACFDSLGSGALLAIIRKNGVSYISSKVKYFCFAFCLTAVLWSLNSRFLVGEKSLPASILLGLSEVPLLVTFVDLAARPASLFGKFNILLWKPAIHLGKISYGFYLYHAFLMPFVSLLFRRMRISQNDGMGQGWTLHGYFLVVFILTLIASMLSWRYIEQPLLRLKRRFQYAGTSAVTFEPAYRESRRFVPKPVETMKLTD